MDINERVRRIRKGLGLTQRKAAELVGVPVQYLCDLERGRNTNPSLTTLQRLATAYGIGVDDLVGYGLQRQSDELPEGIRDLLADPDWAPKMTPSWVETLTRLKHDGRGLQTKQEFLEAYLSLRRVFAEQ